MSITNTTTPVRQTGAQWDFLHPAKPEPPTDEMHGKLLASTTYVAGQVLGLVTGGADAGRWAKPTATPASGGTVGPATRALKYPCITDANGNAVITNDAAFAASSGADKEATVTMYTYGPFFIRDLTGVSSDLIMNQLGRLEQGTGRTDPAAMIILGRTTYTAPAP
jgi:hypothetical protein